METILSLSAFLNGSCEGQYLICSSAGVFLHCWVTAAPQQQLFRHTFPGEEGAISVTATKEQKQHAVFEVIKTYTGKNFKK